MSKKNKNILIIVLVFIVLNVVGIILVTRTSETEITEDVTIKDDDALGYKTDETEERSYVSTEPCGNPITFVYKGERVTYGTVQGQNNTCWMDRNLGASRVAQSHDDTEAYGDLFQWGRADDGHQNRDSGTTTVLSNTDNPGHSNFIITDASPDNWRNPPSDNLWQGVDGINNPCPTGWRIPTDAEWDIERLSWSLNNRDSAFNSPLKLPSGGFRNYYNGSLYPVGSYGLFWSSSVDGSNARRLYFHLHGAGMFSKARATGFSVRCIKD